MQGDATALPWDAGTFSAVTCNCVHCFTEPLSALREMARVVRPGGRVVVVMQGTDDPARAGTVDRWGVPSFSEERVRRMMIDAGFGDVSVTLDRDAWYAVGGKD